ncbi:MAG TPA: ATP-binding cassette domain-containing protein [Saprospiraceae bacterium]|nr:ATP-binding cassette domain-containing protein [Saprospiraceae bacterium]
MVKIEISANEIRELIAQDDLREAIRKFSFFVESYSQNKEFHYQAILLRNELSEANRELVFIGYSQEAENRKTKILTKVLFMIDEIIDEVNAEYELFRKYHGTPRLSKSEYDVTLSETSPNEAFSGVNLTKSYKGFKLGPISTELNFGEITAVIGENASGKTTLLKLISGGINPDEGERVYSGIDCSKEDWYCIKKKIGYLPQRIPSVKTSQIEDLILTSSTHDIWGKENDLMVMDVLLKLELIEHLSKSWNELSGGYHVRFALASLLVWRPKLLVLDEPFANLDPNARRFILSTIKGYSKSRQYPISIIISSQNIEEVESVVDKVIFVDEGRIIFNDYIEKIEEKFPFFVFEIKIGASKVFFENILALVDPDFLIIDEDLDIYTVRFSNKHNIDVLLQKLTSINVKIFYFRDISNSTKRFFI